MKIHRCSECGRKLGLGIRFRNLWDGVEWVHLRFCGARCEQHNEHFRRNANREERWFSFSPAEKVHEGKRDISA